MKKIDDEIMKKRREERLRRLCFFMLDQNVPNGARNVLALSETHNLFTGFFQNSYWSTAWYCIKKAWRHSCQNFVTNLKFFYWYKILRLSDVEIDKKLGIEEEDDVNS